LINESLPVSLNSVPYFIGISSVIGTQNVTWYLSGTNCTVGEIFNGTSCVAPPALKNESGTIETAQDRYFTFTVDKIFETLQFPATVADGSVRVFTQYKGTPTKNITTPTLNYPQLGDWNILYELNPTGSTSYNIGNPVPKACTNESFVGPDCKALLKTVTTSQASPAPLTSSDLVGGDWDYYKVDLTATDPLWVSIAPIGTKSPELYVRSGSIPTANQYDYMGCNLPDPVNQCSYATIINLNVTANSGYNYTWYVGVYTPPGVNVSYGIWFSTTCPPQCENAEDESGTCVFSDKDIGKCICADGYRGLDCQISDNTLPTQYIVLIIIASLVVASAVIGFIAWAYMQRRREGYNPLS
jgi:hypothetical protein